MDAAYMPPLDKRIYAEWENISRACALLWARALDLSRYDDLSIMGAAVICANIYNGIENILKQIAKEYGCLPAGEGWHADLLESLHTKGIISNDLAIGLKGWLSFRHFIRHSYGIDINKELLGAALNKAPGLIRLFKQEMDLLLGGLHGTFTSLPDISTLPNATP
jgi:hypothetical protein